MEMGDSVSNTIDSVQSVRNAVHSRLVSQHQCNKVQLKCYITAHNHNKRESYESNANL